MPMLCCSPDFTQADPALLQAEIDREKRMIEITAFFGGRFLPRSFRPAPARPLAGGRRGPGGPRDPGLLPFAERNRVILILENHYKDNYWQYPEFAQKGEVFVEIVNQIESPWFGVNFDPSNAILAGEDPSSFSSG